MFKSLFSKLLGTSASTDSAPQTDPVMRLHEIIEMLWDSEQVFSMQETMAELDGLEAQLAKDGRCDAAAQGPLAYARGYIHSRREEEHEAIDAYGLALHHHVKAPFLTEQRALSARFGIAAAHEALAQWQMARGAFESVLPDMKRSGLYSDDQIGGTMQRLAYTMHEAGDFQAACDQNRALLEFAKGFLPETSPALCTCLTNLAQNLYELGQYDDAQKVLTRCLDIAPQHDETDKVIEMRFQLGVLAFETGDHGAARDHMQAGLRYAEETGDDYLIKRMQTHAEELDERIAGSAVKA